MDLVICFECMQIEIHDGGPTRMVAIRRSGQEVLDRALSDGGVPLGGR